MQASLNPNKVIAEAFFARHLGGACEPVGRDFDGSSHEVRAGAEMLPETAARDALAAGTK